MGTTSNTTVLPPEPKPLAVGLNQGARLLDISRRTLENLIYSGQLQSFKLNGRRLVRYEDLKRLVRQ